MQLRKAPRFPLQFPAKKNKLFLSLLSSAFLLFSSSSVWAACAPDGTITGANGALILGSAGCADNGNNTATVDSLATITVVGTAGLTAPAVGAPPWNINNNGSITASGAGSTGILVQDDDASISNTGTITISGGGTARGIAAAGAGDNVINNGNIAIVSGGLGTIGVGILNSGVTVTNDGTITGAANAASSRGILVQGADAKIINNDSIILAGNGARGILSQGVNATITNSGDIIVSSLTNVAAIQMQASGGTINNENGAEINGDVAILLSTTATNTVINNSGLITGAATVGGLSTISSSAGGTINNFSSGTITNTGSTPAILTSNAAITINNAGTINGATSIGFGGSVMTNSGTITGNVNFTAGTNNSFTMTGGQMTGNLTMSSAGNQAATFQNVTDANIATIGSINGGSGGNDVLTFNNSQYTENNKITNWETINLNNGSALTLASNLTVSSTTTPTLNINASTLNANDQLNSIIAASGGVPVNVNNNSGGLINIASSTINNSLIIRGNYVSTNGQVELNTVLGDDSSPADKLVIDGVNGGGSASGNTTLLIHNIGGTGAQTTGNGILVVETLNGATTTPDSFTLDGGAIRAGTYDYRLFRGGLAISDALEDDWFLRSTFLAPDGSGTFLPILGPELSVYGSVLPTAMNIGRVTLGTLQERVGDENTVLANNIISNQQFANGGWVRTFAQPYKEKYSSIVDPQANGTVVGAQAGFDLFRNRNAFGAINLVGVYGAYSNADPDIDGTVTNADATADINAHTGSVNLNALTGGAYWTHFWHNGSYFDLVAQATSYRGDADSTRTSMSLRGVGTTESAELGYPFYFNPQLALEPQGQILYQYAKFNNSHDEFSDVDVGSSNAVMGRLGARLKYTTVINGYLVQPYLRANFWSTLSGNNNSVLYADIQSVATNARTNWAQLGGGLTVNVTRNLGVYGFIDGIANLGSNNRSFNGMDAGVGVRAYW
jgi:outer membrane autotransporter protein